MEFKRSVIRVGNICSCFEVALAFNVPNCLGFYPISLSYPFKLIAVGRRYPSFFVHSPPLDFCAADCGSASLHRGGGGARFGGRKIYCTTYMVVRPLIIFISHNTLFDHRHSFPCCVVTKSHGQYPT